MLSLTALLLVVPSVHAERIYRQSCEKAEKAQTLDVAFEVAVERGGKETYRGTLAVASGNRLRAELRGDAPGDVVRVVSDGKRAALNGVVDDDPSPLTGLSASARAYFGRGGVYPTMFRVETVGPGETPGVTPEQVRATGFEWRGIEVRGGHSVAVIGYRLEVKQQAYEVTAWIDTGTHLPLKRVMACRENGQNASVTETYSRVEVDGEIDPQVFELPKGK
jgi:hypothetical protein